MNQENNSENKKVVTRFAPSPTGNLHSGSYRTAMFSYLFAKQNAGKFILRIEDTDKARSTKEFEKNIIESLQWLNIKEDKFVRQSEEVETHTRLLKKLIDEGKAYISKEQKKGSEDENEVVEVVRLKNQNKVVTFTDLIRGEIKTDTTDLKDFVIARNINDPLYHFAVVVDDATEGVTHIIRGDDHIANTSRQILILEALGFPIPKYAHLPLVLSSDRSKLSKRKGALAMTDYRDRGYLPNAMFNFVTMLGWHPSNSEKEIFSLEELIKEFDLSHVQKGGAIFNEEKLNWINKEYIKVQSKEDQLEMLQKFLPNYDKDFLSRVQNLLIERISFYGELKTLDEAGDIKYLQNDFDYEIDISKLAWKKSDLNEAKEILKNILNYFNEQENIDEIISKIKFLCEEKGNGNVLWPLRFTLSGKEKSPDPMTLINIFGIKESKRRIEKVLNLI